MERNRMDTLHTERLGIKEVCAAARMLLGNTNIPGADRGIRAYRDLLLTTIRLRRRSILESRRCCENGYFGRKHKCLKQPGGAT